MHLFRLCLALALGLRPVAAFYGSFDVSAQYTKPETKDQPYETYKIVDYLSGSRYEAKDCQPMWLCVNGIWCFGFFEEVSGGGYNFPAWVRRDEEGHHHVDFLGALDAHEGSCSGPLPCDIHA